jgi:hypothetical protein
LGTCKDGFEGDGHHGGLVRAVALSWTVDAFDASNCTLEAATMSNDWWREQQRAWERNQRLDADITRSRRERESKLQRSAYAAGGARALMALHGIEPRSPSDAPRSTISDAHRLTDDPAARSASLPRRLLAALGRAKASLEETERYIGARLGPGKYAVIESLISDIEPRAALDKFKLRMLRFDYFNEIALLSAYDADLTRDVMWCYERCAE